MSESLASRAKHVAPWVVSLVGVLLANLSFWFVFRFDFFATETGGDPATASFLKGIEVLLMVGFAAVLIYAGYWLATSDYSAEHAWWVSMWCLIGFAGIVTVIVLVQTHHVAAGTDIPVSFVVEELVMGAGGGAIAGLLVGLSTARAMYSEERVFQQRNSFAFLNRLLRHNVLNGIQIIHGHATLLGEQLGPEHAESVRTIVDRSESIADLTQNASVIAGTISGEADVTAVDLESVVAEVAKSARLAFPSASIDVDVADVPTVRGNDALRIVIENVVHNAVEHNDRAEPDVDVSLSNAEECVVLSVGDDGPGVPDDEKEGIFEPSEYGDHRFGLYLSRTIVEGYDGDLWVEDNDPRGAVFRIELPRAENE